MRILFVLVLAVTTVGCVVTPSERFADTVDKVRAAEKIDVVIDSFVVSDIEGKSLGYNVETNAKRSKALKDTIVATLKKKGYKANVVFMGSGFQQNEAVNNKSPDGAITYSQKWKSTGKTFDKPVVLEGSEVWADDAAVGYFEAVLETARNTNKVAPKFDPFSKAKREQSQEEASLSAETITRREQVVNNPPKAVLNDLSKNVLFVKYGNVDISAGKQFGIGLLGAATTLAASGGQLVGLYFLTEKGPMEFVLMDIRNHEVLWAVENPDTRQRYGGREFHKVEGMLTHFPSRSTKK